MIVGTPGNEMPWALELKSRFNQAAATEREGRNAPRAWRTRAEASSVRSPASSTAGACPAARRTVSAKESRSGAGDCADNEAALRSSKTARLRFRDAMEIQVDVSVEIAAH